LTGQVLGRFWSLSKCAILTRRETVPRGGAGFPRRRRTGEPIYDRIGRLNAFSNTPVAGAKRAVSE
jgi:hypothetical protein